MAPRRGAAAELVVEEEDEDSQSTRLKFDEPLSWRAGRAIPVTELLRRLDSLSKELKEMDQERCDKSSLTRVAKELAGANLLNHKDRGIRAFTACCLVDILSLCAPDAPFTPSQLKEIFTLFITSILPALSDPANAYNPQHMYVLASLAEVKSIILLTDVHDSEELILYLFTSLFDIVSGSSASSTDEQISKNVEYHMNSLLVTIVDEAASLPTRVIDVIVAQFWRASVPGSGKGKQNGEAIDEKQSTLLAKEWPAAYRMAKFICDACPEKMARYISQYFNDVILDASSSNGKTLRPHDHRRSSITIDSDDDEVDAGPSEADLKELHKAHKLLRELWRASPSVLQNVIPQLEAELSAENVQLRLLATETLGDIISGIGAAGPPPPPFMDPAAYPPVRLSENLERQVSTNVLMTPMSPESFAQTRHAVYQSFLARKNDKSSLIRSAWIIAIGRILTTSAGGIGLSREDETTLVKGLAEKLGDADERVRIAAVKAVASFSFRDLIAKLAPNGDVNKSGSVLSCLADRVRDRKHPVRVEAMTVISKIWGVAAAEIAGGNEVVTEALSAIPSKVFDAYYANDKDINVLLDHVMFEQLLPLNYPSSKGKKQAMGESQANGDASFDPDKLRTERILVLIRSLDPKPKKAFFALQARQATFRNVLAAFLKKCEEYNGGVMEDNEKEINEKLAAIIKWLVDMLPDPLRASLDLWKYVKLHDRRSYQLIRFSMASESDFKTVFNAVKEFSKRIEHAPGAPAGILDTLIPLILRSASLVYNRSHLPTILDYSRNDGQGLGATAHEVLKEISERNPDVFKAQVKELCKLLEGEAPSKTRHNDVGSVKTLKACAAYARKFPEEIPHDRKFMQAMINFAQFGTPPKAAKYAVSILMTSTERKQLHAKDLLQKTTKDWKYGSEYFLAALATMSQLTLLAPKVTDDASDEILDITTQKILLQVRTTAQDDDPEWQDDRVLDEECQAKCWALKVLANRIRTSENAEETKEVAAPVFRLLNQLIYKEGELSKAQATPKHHKSRLRLVAAQLMLKLCTTSRLFDELLTAGDFINLAYVMSHDSQYEVRRRFTDKLQKYLVQNRLSNRFYTIVFLQAFEPDPQFRQSNMTWIRSRAKFFSDKQAPVMEAILPRLISTLAHHPDYSSDPNSLVQMAQYILFYIKTIASEENLGLIYKYAQRVKQARDAISPTESENMYVLSDLAQAVIRHWQEKKGWNMQSYSGKVGLSRDLFTAMPNHDVAQQTAEKQFLPEEMDDLLAPLIKKADKKTVGKRKPDDNAEIASTKRVRPSTSKSAARPGAIQKPKRPKTPARLPKKSRATSSTPSSAMTNSERRRSGRGSGARKSYADRDDSADDEEMLDGVSKWEYDDGRVESDEADDSAEDEDEEMQDASEKGHAEEEEAVATESPASEPAEPEGDAEVETEQEEPAPPPKTNGRPRRAAPTPKVKPAPKVKAKGKPAAKGAKTKTESRSKAKGKADIFDIQDSE
ncbi:MAG: hypothetical protein M1818_003776 [Claussenomyces sp. TS43310]|nr:MAG: hypothetical protein M1818_003776 [Claussenomyces sp. TS43310]